MLHWLLDELERLGGAEDFAALVAGHPEVLDEAVVELAGEMQAMVSYAPVLRPIEQLLRDAREDPKRAFTTYQRAYDELEREGTALTRELLALENLMQDERWADALSVADGIAPKVRQVGVGLAEAHLLRHAGVAALHLAARSPEMLEVAGDRLHAALDLLPPPEAADAEVTTLATDILVNLSIVYGTDPSVDPQDGVEAAIEMLSNALEYGDRRADPEIWATAQTNLSRAFRQREREDRLDNLRRSVEHAQAALRVRSRDLDADTWVYSQINLADALDALAAAGAGDVGDADAAVGAVIDAADDIKAKWTVAVAHQALASRLVGRANHMREQQDPSASELARRADEHLEEALSLTAADGPRVVRGQALMHAGSFQAGWGDGQRAIELHSQAVPELFPASPRDAREAARALGELHAANGNWEDAAAAYRVAVEAAHVAFHARLYEAGRDLETRRTLNLGRFAAYAIARAGDPVEAALILEDMRALEFRRRTQASRVDLDSLAATAPELHRAYLSHLAELRAEPLAGVADHVSRAIQMTLNAIRAVPGFEHFGARAEMKDIASAIEPDSPLIYVNPSPHGTVLLIVSEQEGRPFARAEFLSVPGDEIFHRLSFGKYEDLLAGVPADALPASYLGTAAGVIAGREVEESLDYVLEWLGEHLTQAIDRELRALGASGVTLVACGPVSAAPLHVARWATANGPRCLLDGFTARFSPSGIVQAAAKAEAHSIHNVGGTLVAVANPTNDLPSSEAEVDEIARLFDTATYEKGARATSGFLAANAPHASVIHMACHARADIGDLSNSLVSLADREITLSELATLGAFSTRLVSASACQTALPDLQRSDEAISVATALLIAGSPCAIASLWPVHDFPTALLMTRLFEELLDEQRPDPPNALRTAQLWLRRLSADGLDDYLRRHPTLLRVFRDARRRGEIPGRFDGSPQTRPYAEDVYWAGFIAFGA